jgi:hypothetical protein
MSNAINYLYEVRSSKVRREKIQLVHYSELGEYQGFRSLYGYTPETAMQIVESNSTAGLTGAPVYSDLLLVDFDDKPELGHKMADELREYDWVKFNSGGRSIHLHVRIAPMFGPLVPALQKEWMAQHFPEADLSIYRTSGIYRLPGTRHESTGRCKKVLETNITGKSLELKVTLPEKKVVFSAVEDQDLELMLFQLLGKEVNAGTTGRNYHVFKIAKVANKLGIPPQSAEHLVRSWNSQRCFPPLPTSSIDNTIKSAYREVNYGYNMG